MERWHFLLIYFLLAFVCSGLHVGFLVNRDTYATQKYMRVVGVLTYAVAVSVYVLALYYFHVDQKYLMQALIAGVMLACLPAALMTVSVATVTAGNAV